MPDAHRLPMLSMSSAGISVQLTRFVLVPIRSFTCVMSIMTIVRMPLRAADPLRCVIDRRLDMRLLNCLLCSGVGCGDDQLGHCIGV